MASNEEGAFCQEQSHSSLKQTSGYITSHITEVNGAGSLNCPWRIEALPGQNIIISIISIGDVQESQTCMPMG